MRGAFQRGLVKRDLYRINRPEFYKRLGAAAASNAVGGAASGAVLSALLDWGKSRSKSEQQGMPKTAADEEDPPAEGLRDFVEIRPHQERMISKMVDNGGVMVAAHGVGTGKTVASIAAFDRLRRFGMAKKMLVVAPAGLRKNYADSVNKFSTFSTQVMGPKGDKGSVYYDAIDPSKSVTVVSYEMFRQAPERIMEATGADMLLLDEYHKVRDPGGTTYRAAVKARAYAPNFLGLTGSITNNDPSEVVTLANLAAGRVLMRPSQFNSAFKQTRKVGRNGKIVTLRNVPQIKKMFGRYVDFLTTEDVGGDMPRKKVEEVTVPMSKEQQGIYDYALQSAGPVLASKIRQNLPMDYKEAAQAFTIIMKARQAANSVGPFKANTTPGQAAEQTPKVRKLLDDTVDHLGKTPDGQVVLYSNLIHGGVDTLVAGLRLRGIDPAVFVGKDREIEGTKITGDLRDQGVSDFLAGKKKAIVLSSAGAEGLDLRNSTMFQSLDGHFNPERTRQAEARVRRLGGLSHRPPEQREVLVRRYFSAYPEPSFMGRMAGQRTKTTTDQWIHSVANQKHTLNTQLTSAFAQKPAMGTNITTANMPKAPVKYIRRWKNDTGEWRYDYPD
jgi:SNF2 family DNA or RNA helicase